MLKFNLIFFVGFIVFRVRLFSLCFLAFFFINSWLSHSLSQAHAGCSMMFILWIFTFFYKNHWVYILTKKKTSHMCLNLTAGATSVILHDWGSGLFPHVWSILWLKKGSLLFKMFLFKQSVLCIDLYNYIVSECVFLALCIYYIYRCEWIFFT